MKYFLLNTISKKRLNETQIRGIKVYKLPKDDVQDSKFGRHTLDAIDKLILQKRAKNIQEAFKMVKGLDSHQIQWALKYDLINDHILTLNFGQHTIDAINFLVVSGKAVNHRKAFEIVKELDEIQVEGILKFELKRYQVEDSGFNEDYLKAARIVKEQGFAKTYNAAYNKVVDLNETQIEGITKFQLTLPEVQNLDFGRLILLAISALKEQKPSLTNKQAFKKVKILDKHQLLGVAEYKLTLEEVHNHNFGAHTLKAIRVLMKDNQGRDHRTAYALVEGLNEVQAIGVSELQLSRENVHYKNFGQHTIDAIYALVKSGREKNYLDAFNRVKGLNFYQTRGVLFHYLTRDQVTSSSFGKHSIDALIILSKGQSPIKHKENFAKIEGLDNAKAIGVSKYLLSTEEVNHPMYTQAILDTMEALHKAVPEENGTNLYEIAMRMDIYKIVGISKYQLTLDQVGIKVVDNQFKQKDSEECNFSESTFRAFEYLRNQYPKLSQAEAYTISNELISSQIIGLIDFGFSLEQVSHPTYKDLGHTLLGEVLDKVKDSNKEIDDYFDFPLSNKFKIIAKKELDNIINTKSKDSYLLAMVQVSNKDQQKKLTLKQISKGTTSAVNPETLKRKTTNTSLKPLNR